MDNCSSESNLSSPKILQQPTLPRQSANRVDRPCDTCRKRKSKCAKDPGQERCVLCTFHDRDCTYFDVPRQRQKRGIREETSNTIVASGEVGDLRGRKKLRTSHSLSDTSLVSPDIEPSSEIPPEPSARSLLDRTLGLHRTTHFKYIGSSSPHERKLLDLIHQDQESAVSRDSFKFRHVADGTTFLSKSDHQTPFSADIDHDLQAVEALIQPHGPDLVELYFRTVHPSYPILHKAVFLEKYGRSYTEFSPALLAAVYLLAMDWWEFDRNLSSHPKPDADALSRLAIKALMDVIYRPKLSSVQAGLLLLQRAGGDSWPLTSQVLAVGEELGLNLDCTEWNIPEWEKGLRRRLAWALLMQDKWGSLIHGRPSHILSSHWQIPPVSLADFPESAADDDDKEGSTEVEKGRLLFIHLTKLTHILCLALETLHTPSQTPIIQNIVATQGVQGLLELVKPLAVQLKDWAHSLPLELHMSSNVQTGKLCSTGHLHLSYFVTEIIIHRHIIRNLSPSTPVKILELCRDAGRARLERAMAFVDALRPEHLQAFWWFAAPKSLAYIRTYGGLLWATSRDEPEREFYRKRLVGFRWGLKVRSRGVRFVEVALREMEESLREIDMSGPPLEDRERVDRGASITGSEVDRAPGYPTGLVPGAVTLVDWEGGGEGGEGMFGRPEQIGLGDFGEAYPGFHQGDLVDASPFGVGVEYAISPEPEARRVNLTQRF